MIEELWAFLTARFDEQDRRTVIPPAFSAATWMSGVDRAHLIADLRSKRAILHNHITRFRAGGETHDAQTMRHLAEPFAKHPDYRQEWRP